VTRQPSRPGQFVFGLRKSTVRQTGPALSPALFQTLSGQGNAFPGPLGFVRFVRLVQHAPASRPARSASAGFTLLETVISLAIVSLLMLVLYLSFSTAATVWNRGGGEDSPRPRQETLARLLADDFRGLRPYTLNWEQGQTFAFAGGAATLFYATTGGLGAEDRERGGLFFSCLFLAPQEAGRPGQVSRAGRNGGLSLFLFKSPYPSQEYFQALHEFAQATGETRKTWLPPESLRQRSVLLLGGLSEAAFSFAADTQNLSRALKEDADPFAGQQPLPQAEWSGANLPALAQLEYTLDNETFRTLARNGTRNGAGIGARIGGGRQ